MNFTKLKEQLGQIAGQWNGDNAGLAEERAHLALEVIDQLTEIEISLKFLNL